MTRPEPARLLRANTSLIAGAAVGLGLLALVVLPACTWFMIASEYIPAAQVLAITIPLAIVCALAAIRLARVSYRKSKAGR